MFDAILFVSVFTVFENPSQRPRPPQTSLSTHLTENQSLTQKSLGSKCQRRDNQQK